MGFRIQDCNFSERNKHAWSTPGFYRRASRVPGCHFLNKRQPLEHARMQSEGFQNAKNGFQNPAFPFFTENKAALSKPGFYRRASGVPEWHCAKKRSLKHAWILSKSASNQVAIFQEHIILKKLGRKQIETLGKSLRQHL